MSGPASRTRLVDVSAVVFMLAAIGFLTAIVLVRPPPLRADQEFRIEPSQGALLGGWLGHPDGGLPNGWTWSAGEIRTDFAVFTYRHAATATDVRVELHQRDTLANPAARTERFALRAIPSAPASQRPLLDTLAASLRAHESAWHWLEAERHPTPMWLRRVLHLQLSATWFLFAQMPLWLALAWWTSARTIRALPRGARHNVLAAIAAGALLRLVLAPHRLVSLYVGYQLTAQAIALHPLPRYGAASALLHHLVLMAARDHRAILWTHSLLGAAVVPLVAAMAAAAFDRAHDRPHVSAGAAWIWALLPPVVAHDNSEANSLPLILWMAAGLVLLFDAITTRNTLRLTGAAALLGLAMLGRPEFVVLVPAGALVFAGFGIAARRTIGDPRRWLALSAIPLTLAIVALCVPHIAHVGESAAVLGRFGSLPLGRAPTDTPIGLIDPKLYPLAFALFALIGAVIPPRARVAGVALLALAGLDVLLTRVDLDRANILRIQVPGALFAAVVAGAGVERFVMLLAPHRRRLALAGVVGLWAITAVKSARTSWRATNEDLEESFIRTARAALPSSGGFDLVRLGYGDLERSMGSSPAHLHFPDYLFASPSVEVTDIADWERAPRVADRPAYFYLGVRCYTPEWPWAEQARGAMRPSCARFRDAHRLVPVVERTVIGLGDPFHTQYYPPTPTAMRLGLYRIER